MILLLLIISLQACNAKNENPLLGRWISEDKIKRALVPNYKETHLQFGSNFLKIDEKKIPVIYKFKEKQVVMFSRGEKVIVHIVAEDKIILFLRKIGKKVYNRVL